MRVYNFAAGPSMLPVEVLEEAAKNITDYQGSGMSVMEMSHRSKYYDAIHNECLSLVRELMNVPDDYEILLVQGGASQQFAAVPLNLMKTGKADYIVTGNFAKKAYEEACRYGDVKLVASSEADNFTYIPKTTRADFRPDADYVHITENNTIFGLKYHTLPDCGTPLVADLSSCIMSEVTDVSKYALIYAGAQKNLAPAGVTLVIVRKDMLGNEMSFCPTMLKYSTQAGKNNSLYNTPPCWAIYMMMLNMRHLKALGGVPAIEKINREKAAYLYDFIDNSSFYTNHVNKEDRSMMNVPFTTPNADLDAQFIAEASKAGFVSLKGHRLVGGMRASIYNAMPVEGVHKLVDFMSAFEKANKQ